MSIVALPEMWAADLASREEGRLTRSQEEEGRSSGNSFSLTAMVTAAAPEELGLADVTMLVTDTSSRHCKDSSVQLVLCR